MPQTTFHITYSNNQQIQAQHQILMNKNIRYFKIPIVIFIGILMVSCKQPKIDFCLEKQVLLDEIPSKELIKIGFSVYYRPESLSSNLEAISMFQFIKDDVSIEEFDFKNYAYVFTFGHRIKGYKILYKKRINGEEYYIIDLEYFDEENPYVYIYKIPRSTKINCEMG